MRYDKKKKTDTRKSDGANILPGSNEYKERLLDLKDIDEKEQDKVYDSFKSGKVNKYYNANKNDIKSSDEYKRGLDKNNNKKDDSLDKDLVKKEKKNKASKSFDNTRMQYIINKRLKKRILADDLYKNARRHAKKTEDLEDDRMVEKKNKKNLSKVVFDNSKGNDDLEFEF